MIERQRLIRHYTDRIAQIHDGDAPIERSKKVANLLELFGRDCDAQHATETQGCQACSPQTSMPSNRKSVSQRSRRNGQ